MPNKKSTAPVSMPKGTVQISAGAIEKLLPGCLYRETQVLIWEATGNGSRKLREIATISRELLNGKS